LFSVGIGSGLTGVGMDLGIVDDPINDGLSEVEREQAWAWFREVFFPRQNANAKLLVVSARLAVTDIPTYRGFSLKRRMPTNGASSPYLQSMKKATS
jgi:hypothetical protein